MVKKSILRRAGATSNKGTCPVGRAPEGKVCVKGFWRKGRAASKKPSKANKGSVGVSRKGILKKPGQRAAKKKRVSFGGSVPVQTATFKIQPGAKLKRTPIRGGRGPGAPPKTLPQLNREWTRMMAGMD